jgi:hypothetical protein
VTSPQPCSVELSSRGLARISCKGSSLVKAFLLLGMSTSVFLCKGHRKGSDRARLSQVPYRRRRLPSCWAHLSSQFPEAHYWIAPRRLLLSQPPFPMSKKDGMIAPVHRPISDSNSRWLAPLTLCTLAAIKERERVCFSRS